MRNPRIWFGATAVVAWASLALQLVLSAQSTTGSYAGANVPTKIFIYFCFFTIWSNIVVAVISTMLARNPDRDGRVFRVIRLDSLLMITVTGLVYAFVLAPMYKVTGINAVANDGLHYVVPVLAILSFLLVGPRMRWSWREVFAALVLPLIWVTWTLIHGAFVHWYPYPFIDVDELGYTQTLINIVGICVVGLVFGFAYMGIDRLLSRGSDTTESEPAPVAQ